VLVARPGDEVRGCAGAILRHIEAGDGITVLIIVEANGVDEALIHEKNEELNAVTANREAALILGYGEPVVWSASVAVIEYGERLVQAIVEFINQINPVLVYAPFITDPDKFRANLGLAASEAVRRHPASCKLAMYEVGAPQQPNRYLDITHQLSQKRRAMECLAMLSPHGTSPDVVLALNELRGKTMAFGIKAAEAFKLIPNLELLPPSSLHDIAPDTTINATIEDPLVSIVIRTTNRIELKDALTSIATQTFRHIEVILVDVDGCGELDVSAWCGQFPIRVVSLGRHLNRGEAANLGMDNALGQFLAFLDDDDWFIANHVAMLISALTANPYAKAAYGGVICRTEKSDGMWETVRIYNEPHDPNRLLIENYLPIHSVIFASTLLGENLRFDESLEIYEDWDFWIQLSLLTDFIHVDQLTAIYRISMTSGIAVRDGEPETLNGLKSLLAKWRYRWTIDQLVAISLYPIHLRQRNKIELDNALAKINCTQTEVDTLLAVIQSARLHADNIRLEIQKTGANAEAISKEIQNIRGQAENTNATIRITQARAESSAAQAEQLLAEAVSINKKIQHARADAESVRTEISYARHEAAFARRDAHCLREDFSIPQTETRTLNIQIIKALSDLSGRLFEQGNEIKVQGKIISDLLSAMQEFNNIKYGLGDKLREQNQLLASLKMSLKREQGEVSRLNGIYEVMVSRLTDIQISSAWRFTKWIDDATSRVPNLAHAVVGGINYLKWWVTGDHKNKIRQRKLENKLIDSGLFDGHWYFMRYPEVLLQGYRPSYHWVTMGWREGRNPHPVFDTTWYLANCKGEIGVDTDPLLHYLEHGHRYRCSPHPIFDPEWYLLQSPDIVGKKINPLVHFLHSGTVTKRSPHPLFDSLWYLQQNQDVDQNGVNPLLHYLYSGAKEGRRPHPLFDSNWYLMQYPGVVEMGDNPLEHYLRHSNAERLSPHPLFDGVWYLREYPEIHDQGINPLVDFVVQGAWEGRNPNPWFDTSWYLQQYPEVILQGINPLLHYIEFARKLGLNPGPAFDGVWYLQEYPDVDASGINPLEHFLLRGLKEGRSPLPKPKPVASVAAQIQMAGLEFSQLTTDPDIDESVPETTDTLSAADLPLRALAFYLPQFHPIPENDRWWGPGFTEWTNVTRAHPQFLGHHQPRLPGALGFYDLRLAEVQREQVRLAHKYGLYGFCYHYYWFGGHRLLDRPLRQVLADPSLDLPFCICWANENWTRRWDGQEQEVLIGQQHSPADDLAFIAELEPLFRDPRYIRVDGKPLLLVYRPQLLPDPAATVARWRQHVQAQGLPGLYLAAVQSFSDAIDTDDTLFDALVEFPPHTVPRIDIGDRYQMLNPRFRGEILDYEACVDAAEAQAQQRSDKVIFPGVMAAWDNTPRRRDLATIFANASPQAYGRWLTAACRRALAAPAADHRLVFINAWNEWAEGSYLEPDQRYGHAYLQATRDVLLDAAQGFPVANAAARARHLQAAASPQLLFVGHDAHRHGAQLLTLHLLRLFARRFGYRPRLWLLGDGALRPDYEAVAEVRLIEDGPDRLEEVASRLHAHGVAGAIVNTVVSAAVLPALASAGLRTLALIHEMPKLIYERGLEANAQAVVTHADQAIFATTTVLDAFRTLAPVAAERALVLPQGIYQTLTAPADARAQVAQELGLPPDALLVINVGYGDARKGFDLFLDAARLTVAADRRFHFLWLGQIEASFGARLERERQTPPLAGHLHQVPFTAEVGRYYQAADLFLLSSREDPFPSVVLEALACGLPVVAFAGSGGHCELLTDTPLNGALVAMGQVRALAQSLRDQAALEAQAPERRPQRAAAARARFDFVAYGWALLRHLDPQLQRVSVVVPNYNYAHYLRARLESLFGQSYPVYEILVLDDASTDTSLQVLESCRRDWDRDLTLVTNDHNSGSVFAQWRQGIARAQGDLVWLAEADDLASPDFLASLAPRFATQPALAFAFSDSAQLDGQGRRLGESYAAYCNEYSDLDYRQDFAVPGTDFLAQGLGVRNTVLNASGVLFRRSALQAALDRVGPALSDWRIAGDWRLYAELCRAGGEVQYVARPLNQHRRHAASVVGANRLDQHLAEITAMHAELSPDLATVPGLARRQQDYRESLRRQ
jgi:glycosyltransferase involved in cell wall biosynthesis/LmbE family N-acetylglucosaminyl deacetylase